MVNFHKSKFSQVHCSYIYSVSNFICRADVVASTYAVQNGIETGAKKCSIRQILKGRKSEESKVLKVVVELKYLATTARVG